MIAAAAEELGDFAEKDRNVVVLTAIDGFSSVSTHEQVASVENTVKLYALTKGNRPYPDWCTELLPRSACGSSPHP